MKDNPYSKRIEEIRKLPFRFVSQQDVVTMVAHGDFLKSEIKQLEARIGKLRSGLNSIGIASVVHVAFGIADRTIEADDKAKEQGRRGTQSSEVSAGEG